jgi:tetratricopeptide (TPR) repeat protein
MTRLHRQFFPLPFHTGATVVVVSAILAACASPPSAQSVNAEANGLLDNGKYPEALVKYKQSLAMARAKEDQSYEAIAMYGMARAYGYQCMFSDSEQTFLASIALRKEIPDSPSAYLTQNQLELARLYIGHKQWRQAIEQFDDALPRLEKLNVPSTSPVSFSKVLQDYALALRESGEQTKAQAVASRIQYLTSGKYANLESVQSFKPYPAACRSSP